MPTNPKPRRVEAERSYYVAPCSGCYEHHDSHLYPYDARAGCRVGGGCDECGYTGKRRMALPTHRPGARSADRDREAGKRC